MRIRSLTRSGLATLGSILLASLLIPGMAQAAGTEIAAAAPGAPAPSPEVSLEALSADICNVSPTWRETTRDWLRRTYPDRQQTTARAVQLLQTVGARKGCPQQAIVDFVGLAKVETCVIFPIDAICLRRFTVPKDVLSLDFQPVGGLIYPGMRAVVPGDPRVTGGVGVTYNASLPASGDAISGLTAFRTPLANGHWRVIMVSGKRPLAQATSTPFGSSFTANDQKFEVMTIGPDRWVPRGAFSNLPAEQAFTPFLVLPGSAPAIVFEIDVKNGEAFFEFPQGAEISVLYFESATAPTSFVLDSAATVSVQTPDGCLAQQEALDRVANEIQSQAPPPPTPPTSPPPGCAAGNCAGPISKS